MPALKTIQTAPAMAPRATAPASGGGSGLGFFAIDRSGLGLMVIACLGIYFLGWLLGNIGGIAGVPVLALVGILIGHLGLLGVSAGFLLFGLQSREEGVARVGFLIAGVLALTATAGGGMRVG